MLRAMERVVDPGLAATNDNRCLEQMFSRIVQQNYFSSIIVNRSHWKIEQQQMITDVQLYNKQMSNCAKNICLYNNTTFLL